MAFLDHRIPPPIIALLCALLMKGASLAFPVSIGNAVLQTPVSIFLLVLGVSIDLLCVWRFFRQRTTVNPLRPGNTTRIVTTGLYRISRNPMYLGMLLVLLAWAAHLGNPIALAGLVFFVLYINRFQIVPEERALIEKFGQTYLDYMQQVRRWL